MAATAQVLGAVPTQQAIVAERFFDAAGGMQLVLHTPFGGRVNRARGFALHKRFCLTFDFELQAAATDDGIVLSLGEQHSFPLDSVFSFIRLATLQEDLIQALLPSPMFGNRWRWNATRALAILRFERGRRVPMPWQWIRADNQLDAIFPTQNPGEHHPAGPIIPPDPPLVKEPTGNCLREAMDVDGLRELLMAIERGEIRAVAVETPAPSLMSHEILNANPYAFLDDAPLEERRARAGSLRRTDADLAEGWGSLGPEAIALVRSQAWPGGRGADELHDFLLTVGVLPVQDAEPWRPVAEGLLATRRAAVASWEGPEGTHQGLGGAERLPMVPVVARADPPPDAGPAAARDRARHHGRLCPLPPTLAAPGTRDAAARPRGSGHGHRPTAGTGVARALLGAVGAAWTGRPVRSR